MRTPKLLLSALLGTMALTSLQASALEYKQIGVADMSGAYGTTTNSYPVYTMSKYGQGINIYKKDAIGLESGKVIKEISFLGYQSSEKDWTDATITVYVGNTTSTTYKDFVIDGEKENSKATTVFDTSKATLFYEGPISQAVAGAKGSPVEVLKISSETGVEYTGENLVVYIYLSVPKANPYTTFYTAKAEGVKFRSGGAYRESGYTTSGYSIFTKSWSAAGTSDRVPVMTLGYEGAAQIITANVKGKIFSSLRNNPLGGATVTLKAGETTVATTTSAASSGVYEFTVDPVDVKAVYTITAECEGYESASVTPDLKAGGDISDVNLTLTKLPVPATLKGFVVDKATSQPISGATVNFNEQTVTSGVDGAYKFDIANVDLLPTEGLALTATAPGYNDYSTTMQVMADVDFNISMEPLPPLAGEGKQIGTYTVSDYDYTLPFNTLWKNSISEMIYPKEMLSNLEEGEKFSSISFYGYLEPKTTPTDPDDGGDDSGEDPGYDYMKAAEEPAPYVADVAIYMIDTEQAQYGTELQGEDLTALTKLYEGPVEITEGGAKNAPKLLFTADFDTPYVYGGKNVKLIVSAKSKESRLVYFALDPQAQKCAISKYADTDLAEEAWRAMEGGVPVVKLGAYVPTAEVKGVVTDKFAEKPLEGAEITLAYETEKYTATTDAEGVYTIAARGIKLATGYTLSVAYGNYNDQTQEVTFTEETLAQTFDFQLTQEGAISGKVSGDKGVALANATVKLSNAKGEVESATTDAEGNYSFTLAELEYGKYTVNVTYEGYKPGSAEKELTAEVPKATDVNIALELDYTGIDAIFEGAETVDVYSVDGVLVKKGAVKADLNALPQGVYVANGKKIRK